MRNNAVSMLSPIFRKRGQHLFPLFGVQVPDKANVLHSLDAVRAYGPGVEGGLLTCRGKFRVTNPAVPFSRFLVLNST